MTAHDAMRTARDRWLADPESAGTGKAFEAGWSARGRPRGEWYITLAWLENDTVERLPLPQSYSTADEATRAVDAIADALAFGAGYQRAMPAPLLTNEEGNAEAVLTRRGPRRQIVVGSWQRKVDSTTEEVIEP